MENIEQEPPVDLAGGVDMPPDAVAVELTAISDAIGNVIVAQAEATGAVIGAIESQAGETKATVQAETGRVLAAVAALSALAGAGASKSGGFQVRRAASAAGVALLVAAVGIAGVFVGALSGFGQPLPRDDLNRATYLWLTHQMKLRDCMDLALKKGGPVPCTITFDLYK